MPSSFSEGIRSEKSWESSTFQNTRPDHVIFSSHIYNHTLSQNEQYYCPLVHITFLCFVPCFWSASKKDWRFNNLGHGRADSFVSHIVIITPTMSKCLTIIIAVIFSLLFIIIVIDVVIINQNFFRIHLCFAIICCLLNLSDLAAMM